MNFEEGQVVLATVEKIVGTAVFVKIKSGGEGTITFSEIAPGRIRNLREYVSVGKTIVAKVLKADKNDFRQGKGKRNTQRDRICPRFSASM
jgi:translation initiation factor 2 subunit 1